MCKETTKIGEESGYVLAGVLILMAISAVIVASNLNISSINSLTIRAGRERSREYFDAENTFSQAVTWLRGNSTSLTSVFSRSEFYDKFDSGNPTTGSNEAGLFEIPTKIKMQGTTNSVILTNNDTLASAFFPSTIDTLSALTFSPTSQFDSSSFGEDMVRVTLVDAIPVDSALDYGDTDLGNPPPDTDFNPVYRIDSMRSDDRGGHIFGYVVGSLVFDYGIGFYGKDFFEMRQTCDSYQSNSGTYGGSNIRANCATGSDGLLTIHQAEILYGSAKTKGTIDGTSPWGGLICADFEPGCPNSGLSCQGTTCNVPGLPTYNTWASYCPSNQGNLVVNANVTVSVAGNAANQKCWNKITVNSNKTLNLNTTTYSYFIDTFDIANNAIVNFSPPVGETINIYVRTFTGDKFNGNQIVNTNNKPYQLRIHYLGTNALDLNGTAAMSAFIVAPYANVTVSGNFDYKGGIKAKGLNLTGSGNVHYDESGDIATLSDVQFRVRNIEGRYR